MKTYPTPLTDAINTPAVCQIEAALCGQLEQRLAECREALRPFANFACAEPHVDEPECFNCIARAALENSTTFPAVPEKPNQDLPQAPQAGSKTGGGGLTRYFTNGRSTWKFPPYGKPQIRDPHENNWSDSICGIGDMTGASEITELEGEP